MLDLTRPSASGASRLAVVLLLALPGSARAQESVRSVTLEEALRLALERSPSTVAAEAQMAGAGAGLLQARGALLPNLVLNSTYGNSSNQRFDQATGQLVSQNYTAQLQTNYEVFGGGRRLAQLRSAGAELDAAEARARATRFQTALRTTELFFAAAAGGDLLRVAEQRLERARQQLEFARTRLELGTATLSDVLRAELETANAELSVVDAASSLRSNTLELGRQIGEAEAVRPAPASLPDRAPPLPPTETLVARALRFSPGVVASEAALQSRRMERLAAYTPYLPSLRFQGGYDWSSFNFPPSEQSWSLRLTASLPLFNGLQREASLQRAQASERVARANARDAELQARVAVETAMQDIFAAGRRVEISDRSVTLAREDLRVQEERYQIGASTILELQTSQVALADAEAAAVRARRDLGTAVARLEAILGESIVESIVEG